MRFAYCFESAIEFSVGSAFIPRRRYEMAQGTHYIRPVSFLRTCMTCAQASIIEHLGTKQGCEEMLPHLAETPFADYFEKVEVLNGE